MKIYRLFLVIIILPVLLGMGSLKGDSSPDKIPIPAKKFKATIIDQTDIATDCSEISIEGDTFISGKKGEGTYTISFDNINSIMFFLREEKLLAVVKLNDGNSMELTVNKEHKAYGLTKYGTFQIKLTEIKKMLIKR
jgi:hypothetical protein